MNKRTTISVYTYNINFNNLRHENKYLSQITRDNTRNLFAPRVQKNVYFFMYFDDTPPQNNTKLFLPGFHKIKYSLAHVNSVTHIKESIQVAYMFRM